MEIEKELDRALHTSTDQVMNVFRKIYEKYSKLVYYFIHKSIKSKEDCEDLTNDVFLGFFNSINSFDTSKSIKAYLFTCASNRIKDYYSSRKEYVSYDDNLMAGENYKVIDKINPSIIEEFKNIINDLEANVIIYHVLYDFTFNEIANNLNISINTIKSAYKRGIKKLRDYFEEKEKLRDIIC